MHPSASRRFHVLPWGIFLILSAVLVSMWDRLRRNEEEIVRTETNVTASQVARRLETYLSTRLGLVEILRDDRVGGELRSADEFREAAQAIQRAFSGFQAINWIDAEGVIQCVVPLESNRAALGRSLRSHPEAEAARTFLLAERTFEPRMTPPIDLLQGGRGFATYFPVKPDGRLEGYVNGVFRIDPLIEDCLGTDLDGSFHLRIDDRESFVYRRADGAAFGADAIVGLGESHVLDRVWTVEIAPTADLLARTRTSADEIFLAFGVALSGALALVLVRLRSREKALRDGARRYLSLVETAGSAILLLDTGGRILEFNREAERTYGVTRQEALGSDYVERFLAPAVREGVREQIVRVMSGEPARSYESAIRRTDGTERVLLWNATRIDDPSDRPLGLLAIGQDITERKAAEAESRRLEERIREAQRLESLGVLAGGIAHDFNNLLTGILGNVGLAMIKTRPESPIHPLLTRIESAAQRSADLTNQLLAYSGKGRFVVQPIALNDLVAEMTHLLEAVVSKKANLQYHLAGELPAIEGDPTQIRQVVMNLITNASDAVEEAGGVVSVRTGVQQVDEAYLASGCLGDSVGEGRYVFLEVTDTGVGMDRETMGRMFDPFFTTKRKGRGLGLAAVQGIVRGHRGTLRVYSEPARGTAFKVLFPSSEKAAESTRPSFATARPWRGEGAILIVDDSETVTDVAGDTLASQGFEVVVAPGGREGVRLFQEHAARIRLVLLDLTMPDLSGSEVFRDIRRQSPDVPILLSSGYSETEIATTFAGRAIAGFIQKPYTPSALLDKVEQVLHPPR